MTVSPESIEFASSHCINMGDALYESQRALHHASPSVKVVRMKVMPNVDVIFGNVTGMAIFAKTKSETHMVTRKFNSRAVRHLEPGSSPAGLRLQWGKMVAMERFSSRESPPGMSPAPSLLSQER